MITGATRIAGVIGDPVRHSLSPALHNAAFEAAGLDWRYVAFPVATGKALDAVAAMRALGISGMSVTMPHKSQVVAGVDELSATAAALEAVNTIYWRGDTLVGDNTDGAGFIDAMKYDEGFDPAGASCVVFGAGGAARAVILALAGAGAKDVSVVNRTSSRAQAAAELAGAAGRLGEEDDVMPADLVVNATPLGMTVPITGESSDSEPFPCNPGLLHPGQLVVDLVYHPVRTPFIAAAREQGAAAVNGLGMLIHQAAHAFRLWTGEDPPLEAMSAAALASLAVRE